MKSPNGWKFRSPVAYDIEPTEDERQEVAEAFKYDMKRPK